MRTHRGRPKIFDAGTRRTRARVVRVCLLSLMLLLTIMVLYIALGFYQLNVQRRG